MPWGQFALSLTPEGRGLCDVIMGRVAPDAPLDGHTMARLAEDFRYFHRGPASAAPAAAESFAHRMRLPAGMRKQGPWTWALSGIHTPSYVSSPWSLDRQTLVGVYHDACGLVINDAQCKESRHVATFVSTVEPTDALPFRAQLDGDVSRLSLRYRDFDAELTVTRISDDELELVARILNCPPGDVIRFHLQPDVHPGAAVTLDAAARTLGAEEFRVAGVRSISWRGVTLSFDREAEAWWPFRGYNSYSANHTYPDLNSARLITEVALTSSQPLCTVRLRVRPDKTAATPP
jgi:hypothetical protein